MIDRVDQHRHAERIREKDELLALVVAHLPGAGQKFDPLHPLLEARLDLPDERMKMTHERIADLPYARIRRCRNAPERSRGDRELIELAHVLLLPGAIPSGRPGRPDAASEYQRRRRRYKRRGRLMRDLADRLGGSQPFRLTFDSRAR